MFASKSTSIKCLEDGHSIELFELLHGLQIRIQCASVLNHLWEQIPSLQQSVADPLKIRSVSRQAASRSFAWLDNRSDFRILECGDCGSRRSASQDRNQEMLGKLLKTVCRTVIAAELWKMPPLRPPTSANYGNMSAPVRQFE